MSASEKLKALDERMPSEPWMASNTKVRDMKALREALPQIVAVVKAAEHVTYYGQEAHRFNEWHGSEILLALAALDEALT